MFAWLEMTFWQMVWAFCWRLFRRMVRNAHVDLISEALVFGVEALKKVGLKKEAIITLVTAAYDSQADNVGIMMAAAKATLPPAMQAPDAPPAAGPEKSPAPGPQVAPSPDRPNLPGPGGSVPPSTGGNPPGGES